MDFQGQRDNGDMSGAEGGHPPRWEFDWTVSDNTGFAIHPAQTNNDSRSFAVGIITNAVIAKRYTVTMESFLEGAFPNLDEFRIQVFEFQAGHVNAKPQLVLAGGCDGDDDTIHRSDLAFHIGGDLELDAMRLETNRDFGVKVLPLLEKNESGEWHFCSSDLVTRGHETDFVVGTYVRIPLQQNAAVLAAHTVVSQTNGDFSLYLVDPTKDGRIYPNGAVKISANYLFKNKTAPHPIKGVISPAVARPIEPANMHDSTYSAEFKFRRLPEGTGQFEEGTGKGHSLSQLDPGTGKGPERDTPFLSWILDLGAW